MVSPVRAAKGRRRFDRAEFYALAAMFHQTLRGLGFDDKPRRGAARFALPVPARELTIIVAPLLPPGRGDDRFRTEVKLLRGVGRDGACDGHWAFDSELFEAIPQLAERALYRVLILTAPHGSTLCPECGGEGYTKSIRLPGDPVLDGDFRRCTNPIHHHGDN